MGHTTSRGYIVFKNKKYSTQNKGKLSIYVTISMNSFGLHKEMVTYVWTSHMSVFFPAGTKEQGQKTLKTIHRRQIRKLRNLVVLKAINQQDKHKGAQGSA